MKLRWSSVDSEYLGSDMATDFGYSRCSRTLQGANRASSLLVLASVRSVSAPVQSLALPAVVATSWTGYVGPFRALAIPTLATFMFGLLNVTAAEPACRETAMSAIDTGEAIRCHVRDVGDAEWVMGTVTPGMISTSSPRIPPFPSLHPNLTPTHPISPRHPAHSIPPTPSHPAHRAAE